MRKSRPRPPSSSRSPGLGPCCGFDPTLIDAEAPPRWATWLARVALAVIVVMAVVMLVGAT